MSKLKNNYRHQKEFKAARIDIRATPTEKAQLQVKAKASGMSLGEYLITTGLNRKMTKVTKAIDKSLYLELCRQGNNLNSPFIGEIIRLETISFIDFSLFGFINSPFIGEIIRLETKINSKTIPINPKNSPFIGEIIRLETE